MTDTVQLMVIHIFRPLPHEIGFFVFMVRGDTTDMIDTIHWYGNLFQLSVIQIFFQK